MPNWIIDDEWARRLQSMWRKLTNIQVTGDATVKNTEDSLSIVVHPKGDAATHFRFTEDQVIAVIFAKVTAATQDGTNQRYKYQGVHVRKTAQGYSGWTNVTGGTTFPTAGKIDYLYNLAEDMNAATGQWGNGITSGDLAGTNLVFRQFPVGRVFRVMLVRPTASNALIEGWFDGDNAIGGSC